MRTLLVMLAVALASCAGKHASATSPAAPAAEAKPCEDARYKKLKERAPADLSDRAFEHFLELDTNCRKDQAAVAAGNPAEAKEEFSPCGESHYWRLRDRPLEPMTDREYTYFLHLDRACRGHRKVLDEAAGAGTAEPPFPCRNERYRHLQTRDLDDMSPREYEYYVELDRACKGPPAPQPAKSNTARSVLVGVPVVGAILAGLVASLL